MHGRSSLAAVVALLCAGGLHAQTYPTQAVRVVVPYAAGGGADGLIRTMTPRLTELFGQQVIVDNRGGGASTVGTQLVAAAKPDGYTMLLADQAFMVNPFLMAKLPYDTVKDFVPVVSLSGSAPILLVHPALPVKSVKDLVALAKSRPGELNYSSGGSGTGSHLVAELLNVAAKIRMVHVPYKGTGPALADTVAGHVTVTFAGVIQTKGLVENGRLRPLAVAASARRSALPQVPTFAEAGWPEVDAPVYRGILVPAGTPRAIVAQVNSVFNRTLQTAAIRDRLAESGFDTLGGTPQEFETLIRTEMEKWGRVIREAGIRLEQ